MSLNKSCKRRRIENDFDNEPTIDTNKDYNTLIISFRSFVTHTNKKIQTLENKIDDLTCDLRMSCAELLLTKNAYNALKYNNIMNDKLNEIRLKYLNTLEEEITISRNKIADLECQNKKLRQQLLLFVV